VVCRKNPTGFPCPPQGRYLQLGVLTTDVVKLRQRNSVNPGRQVFREEKITQMAAFFLDRANGSMNHIKLMKLLYAADRQSMEEYGYPISYDSLSSMPFGPVLSGAVNLLYDDPFVNTAGTWRQWIGAMVDNKVALLRRVTSDTELGALSEADLEILQGVYEEFGSMRRFDVVEYMHEAFPEYTDPGASSLPIRYSDVFTALGYEADDAKVMEQEIQLVRQEGMRAT